MSVKVFADTNILLYAFSKNEEEKQQKALEILDNSWPTISTQVIREFISVGTTKHKQPLEKVMRQVRNIADVVDIINEDMEIIDKGIEIHQRYEFRFYDSLIIAAAITANCTILYSEDMQHGQVIEKTLTIVNPFV